MRDKILVVGGAGYVGGHLVDCLGNYGFNVTVYDNLLYERDYLKPVNFIRGDVRDRKKLGPIVRDFGTVVWLAAVVGDGACARDPFVAQAINEDTVKWLVQAYNGKIIFMSTCSVYGANDELLDEQSETNPLSVYGETKLAAEQFIVNNHQGPYLIFRLGTLFGLSDFHARMRLDLVVNVLTKNAAVGKPLTIFGGDQWRPLLHVRDVASAIISSISNHTTGLYNLAEDNWTIRKIAEHIKETLPIEVELSFDKQMFEDARNYKVSIAAIREKGWNPRWSLKDGIEEIYRAVSDGRLRDVDDHVYSNERYLCQEFRPI